MSWAVSKTKLYESIAGFKPMPCNGVIFILQYILKQDPTSFHSYKKWDQTSKVQLTSN